MFRSKLTRTTALALTAFSPLAVYAANPGVTTGSFAAGEKVNPIETKSPESLSRRFVRTLTPLSGRAVLDIPASGKSGLIIWSIPYSSEKDSFAKVGNGPDAPLVTTKLQSPSGSKLAPTEAASADASMKRFAIGSGEAAELGLDLPKNAQEVIHIASPEAGSYSLELKTPGDAVTVVVAEPESPLTLATSVGPLSRQPGQPLTLNADLRDASGPVTDARVTARLAAPGEAGGNIVELSHKGNGHYEATLTTLPSQKPGFWSVRFEAEGRDAAGASFARTGGSDFMNERGAARLLGQSVNARVVKTADKTFVRVTATADVALAGDYRFDAILSGPSAADGSRDGVAWGESTVKLSAGKGTRLMIDIPVATVPDTLHVDARLLGLDPMGVAGQVEVDVPLEGKTPLRLQ